MRIVRATIKEAYQVHKTFSEYLQDLGQQGLTPKDYTRWVEMLCNEKHRFSLLMHSRKVIGMVWGREEGEDSFLVEGKFLKRAYRGKWHFTKNLRGAYVETVKGYGTIKEIVPASRGWGKRRVEGAILVK